jgi:cysteine desulfurase family protein (TIGR01976 family)
VDATIARARQSVATFLNAADPDEIAFGMNATSFIRLVCLALARTFGDRREIVVTDLDHEANVATWLALERDGATIRWWKVRQDGMLYLADFEPLLSSRTRLVACTAASNAIGTLVDVIGVATSAHAAGAEVFLDAVHYGPHGPMDVQVWECDYLVCSGYKIFAPHMGFLWGRKRALESLPTFREDFIPDTPPLKIEVGTFVYENVAGMKAAIEYLAGLAGRNGGVQVNRQSLLTAMRAIRDYEEILSRALLEGVRAIKGTTVYGDQDPKSTARRVPTLLFNLDKVPPATVARKLAEKGIAARNGHMYSPRLMRRLGLSPETGAVRVSLVHYNTVDEIGRFLEALDQIANEPEGR